MKIIDIICVFLVFVIVIGNGLFIDNVAHDRRESFRKLFAYQITVPFFNPVQLIVKADYSDTSRLIFVAVPKQVELQRRGEFLDRFGFDMAGFIGYVIVIFYRNNPIVTHCSDESQSAVRLVFPYIGAD